MTLTIEQAIGQKLMLAFAGTQPAPDVLATIKNQHVGGVTLFRALNVVDPPQVRALTDALQQAAAASGQPPLLVAADQEGGQLMAIGEGATPFPGNMALGATASTELAQRMGHAIGLELAAMGINVNYAPVCDVNTNPDNPTVGIRSFGEDATLVARMGAALITGMQSAGVAATAKHYPGGGDVAVDPHHDVPVVSHDRQRLDRVELLPFAQAIEAGVRLIMTGHVALPALNDGLNLPATLSRPIMQGVLREEMGFDGVIISDALEMGAIAQGAGQMIDIIAATLAGVDLLLLNADPNLQRLAFDGLRHALKRALIPRDYLLASAQRALALKEWLAGQARPDLDVVGSASHHALAEEIAGRSITLVRDEAQRLPLRLAPEARLALILPRPEDLTPADTSSYVTLTLADAMRRYHPRVDEFVTAHRPTSEEIAAIRERAQDYDLVIAGSINAHSNPEQAALVNALLQAGVPLIAVALRTPYDLAAFPGVQTYVCTYSILEPSLLALAKALWGQAPFRGHLPASIPDMYRLGHGMETWVR
jgi:beta-N-acetylhexosaminidase